MKENLVALRHQLDHSDFLATFDSAVNLMDDCPDNKYVS